MAKGRGRRLSGVLLGTLLATLVAWSPLAVQPALAAGPLRIEAGTTYTVDPGEGRVHVAIQYRLTNNKPNTPTTIYYYRELNVGIQAEARAIRASDASGGLAVSSTGHEHYTEVDVRLRANLYYRRSTTFTLRYDLVGGQPRSDSPIRVSRAFVTFGVWAFGDPGEGEVEVRLPAGFTSTVEGGPMSSTISGSGTVLDAKPEDPNDFFAIVSGESRAAYDESRLSMPGGAEIVVLSWPEDDRWDESVSGTLREGFPELQELVGLDWPVSQDLIVRERYTPALEGYAGIFFTDEERIDVSEDLDPVTIMHEASHAWFNDRLFSSRWIYEGLAEDYAWRVQRAVGGANTDLPREPAENDPNAVDLNTWAFPDVVRDDTNGIEVYGYETSFWLMHLIVETAGEDRMREAFANADANRTAYSGEGEPETVARVDDWRRFLDLTQPLDAPDPQPVLEAVEDYVLSGVSGPTELSDRLDARNAYRDLLRSGDGWTPAWYIREPMGKWQFRDAVPRMTAATEVLSLRNQVEAAAAAESLDADLAGLEAAYEGATENFDAATTLANHQLEAVAAIATAGVAIDTEPDLLTQVGLLGGQAPTVPYEAARTAFEAGDLAGALSSAQAASAILAAAPTLGQERVLMAGIVLVALAALLLFMMVPRRRRGRRPALVAADGTGPSGTLAAGPHAPSPPLGEAPPDAEGGPTHT